MQAAIAELNFRPSSIGRGCGNDPPRDQAIEAVQFLIDRDCDGVVVTSHDLHDDDLVKMHRMHPKMVFLNRDFAQMPEASFCADHHRGGVLAAQTLLAHKHKKIAVISGPFQASDNYARIAGFFEELARNGIDRTEVQLIESDFSPDGGYDSAKQLLASKKRFTGLFCANNTMVIGALSCLQQAGISVLDDMSVVGYDDYSSAAFSAPGLTSVHIPTADLTQNAVRWLLNECYGTAYTICREFPVTVTNRASVAAPAKRLRT